MLLSPRQKRARLLIKEVRVFKGWCVGCREGFFGVGQRSLVPFPQHSAVPAHVSNTPIRLEVITN